MTKTFCRVGADGKPVPPMSVRQIARLLVDRTTGLPNYYVLDGAFSTRLHAGRPFAAFVIDIKGFGRFNERRRGHLRGNELLRVVSSKLRRLIRTRDLLLRWSVGDEFICLAEIESVAEIDAVRARLEGPHSVRWGRRTRLLSCYVVGVPVSGRSLDEVENVLHERLRRLKAAAKTAARN